MSDLVEAIGEAAIDAADALTPAGPVDSYKEYCRDRARAAGRAALQSIEASGWAVVQRQTMVDYFAEIEAAIASVQGALRHRQQPQDVHFRLALKACRDGISHVAAAAKVTP